MFRNYLKIAFRNLLKHKAYSTINVLGLAIGMTCCILIMLFVLDEMSYDTFHENSKRIYRVSREWLNPDGETSLHVGHVAPPIGPLLKSEYPEVQKMGRLLGNSRLILSYGDKRFQELNFLYADPEIFDIFTIDFVKGDPARALQNPTDIVLTEATARKYFGDEEALGQTLQAEIPGYFKVELQVVGVVEELPHNSHFHFDMLASMKGPEMALGDDEFKNWGSNNYATYLLLPEQFNPELLAAKFPDFLDRHYGAAIREWTGADPTEPPHLRNKLHLWPVEDIHLHSHLDSEMEANGNIIYVYIFASVAFFVLLIACINFMNLATARSANRMKEVGLRKVVGAERRQLIYQFLGESIFLAFLALAISALAVELLLPWFGNFVGKELSLFSGSAFLLVPALIAIALFVGLISGSYPAFYLSGFQPARVLKGATRSSSSKSGFRTALVVFQFAISIVLIISMGVVYNQLEYCNTKDLGIDKEHVAVVPLTPDLLPNLSTIKNRLLQHPKIVSVAGSKRVPSGRLLDSSQGHIFRGEESVALDFRLANVRVDHEFLRTYGIELAAGRDFSVEFATDSTQAFILNEAAVKRIGWASPQEAVGEPFEYGQRKGNIIGVVKDFHYESLHEPITPIVMLLMPSNFNQLSVKIRPTDRGDTANVLAFLEQTWRDYRPNLPFRYDFIDQSYQALYQDEHKLGQIFLIFAGLAVFIACLGLFGLASYSAEQRTKEIGVRKVMGATVPNLIVLLTGDFTRLVLFATLLAWPLAYYAMERWLNDFAYSISINGEFGTFILATLAAVAIAVVTVSYQSIRAALSNPIDALRYE